MKSNCIVFIGIKEYDNLGIGYISAILEAKGYKTRFLNVLEEKSETCSIIKDLDPSIIGYSIVFHSYLVNFIELAGYLRNNGISCHFTAGGHYASLQHKQLFSQIPSLDSIVRFEGENTMFELAECISQRKEWRKILGLSYLKNRRKVFDNPHRPFEKDLDNFPFPLRSPLNDFAFQKKFATIIAGRGCIHNCSFCNTRKFYSQSKYSIKRIRRPEMVVNEMGMLYSSEKCEVFLFLDDDFPVCTQGNSNWVIKFCTELESKGLADKIMWKINCRPDEVSDKLFKIMKRHGLFSVFLGIEDGTDAGLIGFNKNFTVETIIDAVEVLKKLKIRFDYGFMLFHPYTTFETLDKNLDFLKKICADGYTPVAFLRMIPFYDTQISRELIRAGRLKIKEGTYDYDFSQLSMDQYYSFMMKCFGEWLRSPKGMYNTSRWVIDYLEVYKYFLGMDSIVRSSIPEIRKILSESNNFLLDAMKEMAIFFKTGQHTKNNEDLMVKYEKRIGEYHYYFNYSISSAIAKLMTHGQNRIFQNYVSSLRKLVDDF